MNLQELLERIKNELRLRNYSQRTIESYLFCLKDYFKCLKIVKKDPNVIFIKKYLLEKQSRRQSSQTINLYLQAIKYFYREIMKSKIGIEIKFAKTASKLPIVLSRKEIEKIIDSLNNSKHKLLIAISYGAGLRVSEVVNLKIKDLNLDELTIHIKGTKGNKDRISLFSEKLLSQLKELATSMSANSHVFESNQGGKLTERTAQKVFETALKKA